VGVQSTSIPAPSISPAHSARKACP
jgi:hypothetical protein